MSESLKGKVAVISEVGSGFAKATAEFFAKLDAVSLVLYDINAEGLKATVKSCEASEGANTGFQKAAQGVGRFKWDESLAMRPEHFTDMVYQTCALTRGGWVSELMVIIGLAQDISGF